MFDPDIPLTNPADVVRRVRNKSNQSQDLHYDIICACCGEPNVHAEHQTLIIPSNDNYEAAPKAVRGNVIALPMWCENGCRFIICFGFHKGFTRMWAVRNDNDPRPTHEIIGDHGH